MENLSWQEKFFKLLYKILKGFLIIWIGMAILVVVFSVVTIIFSHIAFF